MRYGGPFGGYFQHDDDSDPPGWCAALYACAVCTLLVFVGYCFFTGHWLWP